MLLKLYILFTYCVRCVCDALLLGINVISYQFGQKKSAEQNQKQIILKMTSALF